MAEKTREEEIREFAKNWYVDSRETEEHAHAMSRDLLWQASLMERRDPSQCRLIRNRCRTMLRRGADPATAPDECAAEMRNTAAIYAEVASRAPDYPARSRQGEKHNKQIYAQRNKQDWEEETKQMRSINPDEWRAHWIRVIAAGAGIGKI
jgi:hypothetical protein